MKTIQPNAFLGISWNLITNEITPTTYLNMSKKTRGVSGEKKLMEMDQAEFTDPSFVREITRCTLSRLAAQAYDRLGVFIGPIISCLTILVSRSTEIATIRQLDKPLIDLEP